MAGGSLKHKIEVASVLIGVSAKCIVEEGVAVFCYKTKRKIATVRRSQYDIWKSIRENDIFETEPLSYEPLISVVVPVYNVESQLLRECIDSVRNQTYQNWELCLVDDCSTMESVRDVLKEYEGMSGINITYREENGHISRATNTGIEMASGEFVALLDCDDLLAPNALYEMAKLLNDNPDYDFIYSDEDKMSEDGTIRKDPFFKPDWSPDTFMSLMYTCHFSMFRKSLLHELGGLRVGYEGSQDYDLVLRVTEKTKNVGHVPKILYHWRERVGSTADDMGAKPYVLEATQKTKMDALARRGQTGRLEFLSDINMYRVVYDVVNNPKVSVIIPSKDNYKILRQCLVTLKECTTYKNIEIIVVDNGSSEENRKLYSDMCQEFGCIYEYDSKEFNFSYMCNHGVSVASGDYYLFLNDDIEIRGTDWLERMLGHAQLPHIGAVGCKLLYPKSTLIQHDGVINLKVGPGHALYMIDDRINCYWGRNLLEYNYSVVTGACLLVSKEKFDEIGGFDESFPVAYNDVELCFKLLECGYYNVVRNDVSLVHHESISRGYDDKDAEKEARLHRELKHLFEVHPGMKGKDACYNPNLVLDKGDFSLDITDGVEMQTVQKLEQGNFCQYHEASKEELTYDVETFMDGHLVKIDGWCFETQKKRPGDVTILLKNQDGEVYFVDAQMAYRPDRRIIYKKKRLAFSGFEVLFYKTTLPEGDYEVYLGMKDMMVLIGNIQKGDEHGRNSN